MRYRDNREQSAELLRMVLPLMSRHSAAFHPLSYAVWYEYSAGVNQPLKAAIDQRTADGRQLGDADIQELFDQYVAMRDIESTSRLRTRIQAVVAEVDDAAMQASEEVGRYSAGLGDAHKKLQVPLDPKAVATLIDALMDDTTRVLDRTSQLHESLRASAQEARRLGAELEAAGGKAQVDPLTGLHNRRGFELDLAGRHPHGLPAGALLLAEIDRLDLLAGQYGHVLADRAIVAVAQILVSTAGVTAVVARLGSGQFGMLLAGASPAVARELGQRIRSAVEQCRIRRQDSESAVEAISVALGIAAVAEGDALADVLARADRSLAARGAEAGA